MSVLGLHNCQIRGYSLSAFTNVAIIKQVSKQADRKITFRNVLSQIFVLELTTQSVKLRALFSCFFCFLFLLYILFVCWLVYLFSCPSQERSLEIDPCTLNST